MAGMANTLSEQTWAMLGNQGLLTSSTYSAVGDKGTSPSEADILDEGTAATTTDYTVDMRIARYRQRDIDGVRIHEGDRMGRIPKTELTPVPTTRDYITVSSTRWDILNIDGRVNDVEWQFHLRRVSGALAV